MINQKKGLKLKSFIVLVCMLALVMGSAVPVQADTTAGKDDTPVLLVGATGTATVAPDQARISLAVTSIDKNLAAAQNMNNQTTENVISALLQNGIEKKSIKTLNYRVYPQYNYNNEPVNNDPPQITGYRINNEIAVVVNNLDNVGKVLDAAVKAGANNVNYINFEKADISLQENEALTKAVLRARSKAEAIAAAAGMSLGRVIKISESGVNTIFPPEIYMDEKAIAGRGAASQVPISPGDMEVTASIYITYELK